MARRAADVAAMTGGHAESRGSAGPDGSSGQAPGSAPERPGRYGQADLRSLARGGSLNIVGAATAAIANVVLVVLVARGFRPQTAGVFFTATSVFLLAVVVARLGTQTGLVYFIARFRARSVPSHIGRCLRVALPPVAVAGVMLAVAGLLLAPHLAGPLIEGESGRTAGYLRVLCVFLPMAALSEACLAATRGFGTMRPTVLLERIGRPVTQVVLTLLAIAAGSAAWLPVAWAGPYVPVAALAALALARRWRRSAGAGATSGSDAAHGAVPTPAVEAPASPGGDTGTPERPPTVREEATAPDVPSLAKAFWRYTSPRALVGIAQLGLQRVDIILVAALLGAAEAAVYTAATRFLIVGQLTQQALAQAIQPQFGGLFATADHASARDLYRVSTSWLILLAWPLYLLFASFAAPLMDIFGETYKGGAAVVVILSLAMLAATGCGAVDVVLSMAGRSTSTMVNTLLALAVNIGLDVLLIPRLGIVGAAVGWALALLVKNLVPLVQVALTMGVHPFGAGTLSAAALALTCFGALPLAVRLATDGLTATLAASAAGVLLYAAGCWHRRGPLRLGALRSLRSGRRLAWN